MMSTKGIHAIGFWLCRWKSFGVVSLMAAWYVLQSAVTAEPSDFPFLLHDPGFDVDVQVAPWADDFWIASQPETALLNPSVLHIPSTVLNISVVFPDHANVSNAQVAITLFKDHDGEGEAATVVDAVGDTVVQYARSYRIDVGSNEQRLVLRVYVEAHAGAHESSSVEGVRLRAFYKRRLDLSPSTPNFVVCPESPAKVALRILSFPRANMPPDLCAGYTLNGSIPLRKWYFDDQTDLESTYRPYSRYEIEELIMKAQRQEQFYYGATDDYLFRALEKYPLEGKHVLVVGSTFPWYESICIAKGAASCTTIDHNKVHYDHPGLETYTLSEFQTSQTVRRQFDVILSISSFEHDGLGRYGDPLDPEADLKAMKAALNYAHPDNSDMDTLLLLAVPVGQDAVIWNAQRVYGPIRLPLLLQHWEMVESFGFSKSDFSNSTAIGHQPVFVLRRAPAIEPDTHATAGEHSEL